MIISNFLIIFLTESVGAARDEKPASHEPDSPVSQDQNALPIQPQVDSFDPEKNDPRNSINQDSQVGTSELGDPVSVAETEVGSFPSKVVDFDEDDLSTLEEQIIQAAKDKPSSPAVPTIISEPLANDEIDSAVVPTTNSDSNIQKKFTENPIVKLGMAVEATEYHYVFNSKNNDPSLLLHANSTRTGKFLFIVVS